MKYHSNSRNSIHMRTYYRKEAVAFRKTREEFGGLSNMAAGFPLEVNGLRISTSEALYQACRFPYMPEIQRIIIGQRSPMTAKMKSKPHRRESRADWDQVKVKIMRWCLHVKLAQNWSMFSQLLLRTGNRPIVEESLRDDFWGAKVVDAQTLIGINALGRLLMELREKLKQSDRESLSIIEPLAIPDFLLDGRAIGAIFGHVDNVIEERDSTQVKIRVPVGSLRQNDASLAVRQTGQGFLFDSPNPIERKLTTRCGTTNKLKPYPAYKNSGVPWLGDVPEHWNVNRGKWLFQKINRPCRETDDVVTCFRDGVVTLRKNRRIRGFTESLKEIGYQGIRKGDLVIHAMDAFAGAIGVSDSDGKGTPVYQVLESTERSNAYYYAYTIREMAHSQWILALAKGIRERSTDFRYDDFASQLFPLPPPPEQAAIVRFMDHVDRRVRRYVRAKQKLIGLLEEQKQVIINHAVTRGLDPNVRLKPSEIEWLGEIPEHWSIKRLRFLVKDKLTYGANEAADHANSEWPRYLRITDFRLDGSLREDTFCSLPPQIAKDYLVQPGDILFARSGATVGKTFLVGSDIGEACHAGYLIRARPNRAQIEPAFLFAFTQSASFSRWKDANFSIATIQNISANKYADLHVPVPSINEQRAILAQLDTSLGPHQTLVGKILEEIKLIKGYYARLIADVVMGKLDVRAAAAALPDEPDEPETVDVVDALAEDEGDIDIAALPEEIEA